MMNSVKQPPAKQPGEKGFHSGFVALTGRPNAGKSTLINQLAGMDLAITSPKPQTTRTAIRAIIDRPHGQIILVDTPGLLQPKNRLGKFMAESIARTVDDADIVLLIVDAESEHKRHSRNVAEIGLLARLKEHEKAVILVLNKVDLLAKELLLPIIAQWSSRYPFAAIIPVSARTGDGIMPLEAELLARLPEGPRYFPEDSVTDQTERVLAGELIREQILRHTHQEIPHGSAVVINAFEEEFADGSVSGVDAEADGSLADLDMAAGALFTGTDMETDDAEDDDVEPEEDVDADDEANTDVESDNADIAVADGSEPDEVEAGEAPRRTLVRIDATIVCEKDSHKGILIGKGGSMLKAIGTDARLQIEKMVDCRVYLELRVKVREDWQNRTGILRDLGYIQDT